MNFEQNRPLEFSFGGGDIAVVADKTEVVAMVERVLNVKFLKLNYDCSKYIIFIIEHLNS